MTRLVFSGRSARQNDRIADAGTSWPEDRMIECASLSIRDTDPFSGRANWPRAIHFRSTKIDRRIWFSPRQVATFRCAISKPVAEPRSNSPIPARREAAGYAGNHALRSSDMAASCGRRPVDRCRHEHATTAAGKCAIVSDKKPAHCSKSEQLCAAPRIHTSSQSG